MNGSKSTFKRKGYWLTAFAAAVLLAASPGTASAQSMEGDATFDMNGVKVEAGTVEEGNVATITVSVKATVTPPADPENNPDDAANRTVTVTVTAAAYSDGEDDYDAAKFAEGTDYTFNPTTANEKTIVFPADTDEESVVKTATFNLYTNSDPDAEDEDISISVVVNGTTFTSVTEPDEMLTIEDDETQTYELTLDDDQEPKEGDTDPITLKLEAVPEHVNGSELVTIQLNAPRTTASIAISTPGPFRLGQPLNDEGDVASPTGTVVNEEDISITVGSGDMNRVEDTIVLSAYSGSAGRSTLVDSLSIDIEDKDALPAVAMMVVDEDGDALDPQPTSVAEGETTMVAVMVVDKDGDDAKATEDLTVQLMPTGTANSADYILVGSSDIDDEAGMSGPITIEVRSDEDVGRESLMFDAVVTGDPANGPGTRTSAGVLSLYIEDETTKKIEPKASEADYVALMAAIAAGGGDDGVVNPGDAVTLMTSDLFDVMDGYTASYGVSVEGDSANASASGEEVTINALKAGEAKITVTGTARMASSSLIPTQTVSNVAELTFPVMVVDTTLVVTLSADPMEVEAGGTTMITATANRAVTAGDGAVAIALAVVPSDGGTLDAESIMIAMGAMSGSATLTANESVTVVASGSGVTGLMQVAVTVTAAPEPVPEPVPALPLIGQLLLGLGLLGGGARHLYRRRRQG